MYLENIFHSVKGILPLEAQVQWQWSVVSGSKQMAEKIPSGTTGMESRRLWFGLYVLRLMIHSGTKF